MKGRERRSSVRVLVTLSALSAIGIILGKFLAFNVTEFMRFSLENITIIFSGIVFGPVLGAVVGAVQDLVGCLAVGYTINPIITLGSALIGAVSGAVWLVAKRLSTPVRLGLSILSAHILGSVIVKSIGLAVFYSLPFDVTALWRLLNYTIVGTVEAFILYYLFKSKQLLSQINKITPFSLGVKFKSASEASAYVKNVSGVFSKPGLERVEALLEGVGDPERSLGVVHVTGTNGKGSFVAMLSSILTSSSLKVGTYTSPYLYEMRESIRIGGEPISEETMLSLLERLGNIADGMSDKPTEFELLTAAAYLAFSEAGVDVAIIECGMGARRDATNVIDSPLLSVITGISIDHTSFLGASEREIATEKSGVIKKDRPILFGRVGTDALEVITNRANELGAKVIRPDEPEIKSMALDGSVISVSNLESLHLALLGIPQPYNAALAVKAANVLSAHFPSVTEESIRQGISAVRWPARFELLSDNPIFIYDGAHNLEGITSAVESIKTYFGEKVICLTGVLADKEYERMADEIVKVSEQVITITPPNPRALAAEDYALTFKMRGVSAEAADSIESGVKKALAKARERGLPVVTLGSLYIYREVNEAVKNVLK
ncbi:MAG: folate family ECF transporter S component [Clostridia bacterium]|nr:folate family ECF transporter S component [Clostridia bacterium]